MCCHSTATINNLLREGQTVNTRTSICSKSVLFTTPFTHLCFCGGGSDVFRESDKGYFSPTLSCYFPGSFVCCEASVCPFSGEWGEHLSPSAYEHSCPHSQTDPIPAWITVRVCVCADCVCSVCVTLYFDWGDKSLQWLYVFFF